MDSDRPEDEWSDEEPEPEHGSVAWMDIHWKGPDMDGDKPSHRIMRHKQRVTFNLYDKDVPKTVQNFKELCSREEGRGYKGCRFYRIFPGFMIESGDFKCNNGTGGESIYGPTFEDENLVNKHRKKGLLTMASRGPNKNTSCFSITAGYTPWLDGKCVVFGEVADEESMDTIIALSFCGDGQGKPLYDEVPTIIDCGVSK